MYLMLPTSCCWTPWPEIRVRGEARVLHEAFPAVIEEISDGLGQLLELRL